MELTEISDRIDIMLNAFELPIEVDEYEKSIYLTKAQTLVHKELVQAFEVDETISVWVQPYLAEFVTDWPVNLIVREPFISNAIDVVIPEDVYKIVAEKAYLKSALTKYNNREVKVLKSRMGEIIYKLNNPFRTPNENEIIRIINHNTDNQETIQLVLPESTELLRYHCKYIRTAQPIILEALPNGLTIDGQAGPLNTLFDDDILERIIEIAVLSLKQDKTVSNQQNV